MILNYDSSRSSKSQRSTCQSKAHVWFPFSYSTFIDTVIASVTVSETFDVKYINCKQSRLNVPGGHGPARLMGPLSSLGPTWRGGPYYFVPANSAIHTGSQSESDMM